MTKTKHLQIRMQQRCLDSSVIGLVLDEGVPNNQGDKEFLGTSRISDLLNQIQSEISGLKKEQEKLQRLKRRGGTTLVNLGGKLLTIYPNDRKKNYAKQCI